MPSPCAGGDPVHGRGPCLPGGPVDRTEPLRPRSPTPVLEGPLLAAPDKIADRVRIALLPRPARLASVPMVSRLHRMLAAALLATALALPGALPSAEPALFRVAVGSPAERVAALAAGDLMEDYGHYLVVRAEGARAAQLRAATSGSAGLAVEELDFRLGLRSFRFDPSRSNPARSAALSGAARVAVAVGGDYHVIQFQAPVRPEWVEDLRRLGAEPIQYLPNHAWLVFAPAAAMERVALHAKVRWTGAFEPIFRVSPALHWIFAPDAPPLPAADDTYLVATFRRAEPKAVESALATLGEILSTDRLPGGVVFDLHRMRLPPEALARVAALPDVYALEPYVAKTPEDERGAQVLAGNYTGTNIASLAAPPYNPSALFGTDGTGVTVAVVDSGLEIPGPSGYYLTAARAVSAPLRGASGASYLSGHGHLCGSIIGGSTPFPAVLDNLGYNFGRGVAPGVNLVSVPLITGTYTGTDAEAVNDAVTTVPPNGVRATISNNSWGAGNGTDYSALEAMFDGFARDASTAGGIDPLLFVFSAGNSGPSAQTLTRPKAAKNVLTVGSSVGLRPELPSYQNVPNSNLDYMSNYSARGPAQDGRLRPEVVAPGQQITGPRTSSNADAFTAVSGDANHVYSSGTSFAAPHAAGGAAIFSAWWKAGHSGSPPSPALIKAALVNGAVDMNAQASGVSGSSSTAAVPNNSEGWGRINLRNSVNSDLPTHYVDQNVAFAALTDSYTYFGTVASGTRPLRITLAWTDVPAAAGANPALVNDLDLIVTVGANTYRGNVFAAGVSTTGGSPDRRNNVENVILPNLAAGTNFSVRIVPAVLAGNGVLGTAGLNQHFALVVQNASASSCPAMDVNPTGIPGTILRGTAYPSQSFSASGGVAPVSLSVVGALPPGLTFSGGVLSGTPTAAGSYAFTVNALDANGCLGSRPFAVEVVGPTLQRTGATLSTGNALLEPSECNVLNLTLTNAGTAAATSLSAVLTTSTPGVSIASGPVAYADLTPGASGQNLAPFFLATDASAVCYTSASFTLTVQSAEDPPVAFDFTLPIGSAGQQYGFAPAGTGSIPAGVDFIAGSRTDDAVVNIVTPVDFACQVYRTPIPGGTPLKASTNGTLQFDTAGSRGYTNRALPVSTSGDTNSGTFPANRPTLFPYWDDLDLSGATSGIYTSLTGAAPNRVFTVEWRGAVLASGAAVNFAVLLREGSSTIDFVYNNAASANGLSTTVGAQPASSGPNFTQFGFNQAGNYSGGAILRATLPADVCTPGAGPCNTAPAFTSGAPTGPVIVGQPYLHQFAASGQPAPEFNLAAGALPPGLNLSRSGLLAGTATAAGNGLFAKITVAATNGTAPAATQSFDLTVVTRSASYLAGFGLAGPAAAPQVDFDLDGLSNLLEYAFGLDPTRASINPGETIIRDYAGTRYLAMRFPRSTLATDLTYIVEVAADLGADPIVWTELARSTAGAPTTGPGLVSETGSAPQVLVEVRDTVPVPSPGQPQRFLRLRVE